MKCIFSRINNSNRGTIPLLNRVKVEESRGAWYLAALFLLCLSRGFEGLALESVAPIIQNDIAKIMQTVSAFLLLPSFILNLSALNIRSKFLLLGSFIIIACSYAATKSTHLIWAFLFIIAGRNISLKDAAKVVLSAGIITLIIGILLCVLGLSDNIVTVRGTDVRFSLGFNHSNRFGQVVATIVISWLVVRYKSLSILDCLLCALGSILVLVISGSRTTFIGVLVGIAIFFISKICFMREVKPKSVASFTVAVLLILVFSSVALMLLYDYRNPIISWINQLLSGRLGYPRALFDELGLSLFGTDITISSKLVTTQFLVDGEVPIDNVYLRLLIVYGIIPFVFVTLVYIASFVFIDKYNSRTEIYLYIAGSLTCFMMGFCEAYVLDITFNVFLIMIGKVLFQEKGAAAAFQTNNSE